MPIFHFVRSHDLFLSLNVIKDLVKTFLKHFDMQQEKYLLSAHENNLANKDLGSGSYCKEKKAILITNITVLDHSLLVYLGNPC